MSQTTFYPSSSKSALCESCYTGQSQRTSSSCSGSNTTPYCDSCNSICNSAQNYGNLSIGKCSVLQHPDIDFSGFNAKQGDFIYKYWTADKWNELQEIFSLLYSIGNKKSTEDIYTPVSFTQVCKNENSNNLITADQYNAFIDASTEHFNNDINTQTVEKDNTIISKSLSDQLDKLLQNSFFNSSICDICNVGSQHSCTYNCACNYNCCNYDCQYNCQYNCCNHNCSCNYNDNSSDSEGKEE